tara:strand:- start:543 stop:917 length:375 start_codon:yes stop_codon:yes gene_type:complete
MASPENKTSHLTAKPISVATDVLLQIPLSRRGAGPGLLLVVPKDYQGRNSADVNKTLDPEPLQKWAEEGYAVVEARVDVDGALDNYEQAIKALLDLPQCTSKEKIGIIGIIYPIFYSVLMVMRI